MNRAPRENVATPGSELESDFERDREQRLSRIQADLNTLLHAFSKA